MWDKLQLVRWFLSFFKKPTHAPELKTDLDEIDRAKWMDICDTDLVVDWREIPGSLNNSKIVEAFEACGYGPLPDETSWCGVYAASVLIRAGYQPPHDPAWARHYSHPSWGETLTEPKYGCIANVERNGPGGDSHVGFVVSFDNKFVRLHGGNQSNRVTRNFVVPLQEVIALKWPKETL